MNNTMDLKSKDFTADFEAEFSNLFSSITENPSRTDNFKRIYFMCENNITDEVKIILLSRHSLSIFRYHLKTWNSEKPNKAIIENLKLMLFLTEKLPELKYKVLIKSRYITELVRIYNSCLKYLFQRKQEEIDDNCMLYLALFYISNYAVQFCINDETNRMSSFGQHFFKQALSFLRNINIQFTGNPNNCVYLLILTSKINAMMAKFSGYRSLFVELDGIQYCLKWISDCHRNKNKILHTLYYDLLIFNMLDNFVDDPYFYENRTAIVTRLIKYLQFNGERILDSNLLKESNWIFQFACSIIIKMAMGIRGFKEDVRKLQVKQLFMSFLNKYPTGACAKTIFTTILVLEDITESKEHVEDYEVLDIFAIMSKCERLTNILLLSKIYSIPSNETDQEVPEVIKCNPTHQHS